MPVRTTFWLGLTLAFGVVAVPVAAWSGTLAIGSSDPAQAQADSVAADGVAVPLDAPASAASSPAFALDDGVGLPPPPSSSEMAAQNPATSDPGAVAPAAPRGSGLMQALSYLMQSSTR